MSGKDFFDFLDAMHNDFETKGFFGGQNLTADQNGKLKKQHGIFQSSIFPLCWAPESY